MDIPPRATKAFTEFFMGRPKVQFEAGKIIHTPGESPRNIYFIEEGFVKLYGLSPDGNEKLLVMLTKGEVFSLTAALLNQPTGYYAETMRDSTLRAAPSKEFLNFVHTDVALMDVLMSMLIKIVVVMDNRVFTLSLTKAYDRLLSRLEILIKVFGTPQDDGSILINAPLTHQDIGNSINLSRESTSKAMGQLQAEGVLRYKNGTITVLEPRRLVGPGPGH